MGFRIGDTSGPLAYHFQGAAGVSLTPASSIVYGGAIFPNPSNILRLTPDGSFAYFALPDTDEGLSVSSINPLWFEYEGKTIVLNGHQNTRPLQENVYARSHDSLIENPADWTTYLEWMGDLHFNFIRLWIYWSTGYGSATQCATHPFKRTGSPATDGLPKFDLTDFDTVWWTRLDQMLSDCEEKKIIVSVMIFDAFTFDDSQLYVSNPWNGGMNVNGVDANADGQGWALEDMFGSPTSQMLNMQHGFIEHLVDVCNPYKNVMYEIANEIAFNSGQRALVNHIQDYQEDKPNQHPVWLSAGGRIDNGNVNLFTETQSVDGNNDVWGPSGNSNQGWSAGKFYPDMPIQTFADKPGIIDTDHGISPDFTNDLPWKAFTRGYHYNQYEKPNDTAQADGSWFGAPFPYPTMYESFVQNVRTNVGKIVDYANNIFADLALMTPTDNLGECSTGYCLRDAGKEYLVFSAPNTPFTITGLTNGERYEYEWWKTDPAGVTNTGLLTEVITTGEFEFTPAYGNAVCHIRLKQTVPVSPYPDNYPNLYNWDTVSSWKDRMQLEPFKSTSTYAWLTTRQGHGMFKGTFNRLETKAILDEWRGRNPKGVLLDHLNYRHMTANESNSNASNRHWRPFRFIVQGGRQHLLANNTSGFTVGGKSVASGTNQGDLEIDINYHLPELYEFLAEDFWDCYSDDDSVLGGTGVEGPGSIVGGANPIRPVMFEDNWGTDWHNKWWPGKHDFSGYRQIITVLNSTRLRINQLPSIDLTGGPADGNGFLPVEVWMKFMSWPQTNDNLSGITITGYKTDGGNAQIELDHIPVGYSYSAGDDYRILDNRQGGETTEIREWDDPPSQQDYGENPIPRINGTATFLLYQQQVAMDRFGFWCPPVSNGIGTEEARRRYNRRSAYPSLMTGSHALRQIESGAHIHTVVINFTDGLTYRVNSTNQANLDEGMYSYLWLLTEIDLSNPSVPADYFPPSGRGVFIEWEPRKLDSNMATAVRSLTNLDAAAYRSNWALQQNLHHTIFQPKIGASGPVMAEESLFWPGDPTDPTMPHDQYMATIDFVQGDGVTWFPHEPVVWRTPDAGEKIYITVFPEMLVAINMREPAIVDPWIPHYIQPGGQAILDPQDVIPFTLLQSYLKPNEAWFYFDTNDYINPVWGTGPSTAPWTTDPDTFLLTDENFNTGAEVVADVNLGALEGMALRKKQV